MNTITTTAGILLVMFLAEGVQEMRLSGNMAAAAGLFVIMAAIVITLLWCSRDRKAKHPDGYVENMNEYRD